MTDKTFYYGRGASACIAVQIRPGNYARVFIGNGKTLEQGECLFVDRGELINVANFFEAIWHERGHDIFVSRFHDDPHDEVFSHHFNMNEYEGEAA